MFDAPKLVTALQDQTYIGLTRPWAYVGATALIIRLTQSAQSTIYPHLVHQHVREKFSAPELFELWLFLILPFMALFYFLHTKSRPCPPTFSSSIGLWLYIFGSLNFFLLLPRELALLATGINLNDEFSFGWQTFISITGWWFGIARSAWLLAIFHEDEDEIGNLAIGALSCLWKAALFYGLALSAFEKYGFRPRDAAAWFLSLL
jgi:hypothetical protein